VNRAKVKRREKMVAVFAFAALSAACSAAPFSPPSSAIADEANLAGRMNARLEVLHDDLIAFRRDLHRYPETSGNEAHTAARIADRLEALGFRVRRAVGGHGVVAFLQGGRPGPIMAFRADMDAMPSDAPDPVDFRSLNPGVRHICGHDIHATIGVALAEAFAAVKQDFPGAIVLIFQPAEENASGARLMLEAGALEAPRPDAIFAYHTAPYEIGQIAYSETTLLSARDRVTATVSGPRAQQIAADLRSRFLALSTIDSPSELQPIGADYSWVSGPPAARIANAAWEVNAYFSLATDAARRRLRHGVEHAVEDLARSDPATHLTVDYLAGFAPGVTNDAALTRSAEASIRAALGEDSLVQVRNVSPGFSEDFGRLQAEVPGVMFFLGVSNERQGWVGLPHSPNYVADEESIFVGARAMARIMLDNLEAH
jgi:metal-dependent amidase/aminoacylase/carboxypeptidase family protein